MARKMILVSEDVLNKLKNAGDSKYSPEVQDVPTLDVEMRRILEKPGINQSEKLTLYNQTLQRHLKSKKPDIENTLIEDKSLTNKRTNWISEISTSVPTSSVNDAIALYNWISRNKTLSWSETGELEINTHPISGSNVVDLIYDAIRKTPAAVGPIGFEIFYRMLLKYNVPKKFIKNPSRVKLINSISSLNVSRNVQGTWVYV